MEIETERIKISFHSADAGRMCSVLDHALSNNALDGREREFALRLKAKIEGAFNW